MPELISFNVTNPLESSDHEIGTQITVVAEGVPAGADDAFKVEAGVGTSVISDHVIQVDIEGACSFDVVSVSLPEIRQTVNINGIEAIALFSLDNTKKELQEELDGKGIEYKATMSKQELLD